MAMSIRWVLILGLLVSFPSCGRVSSSGPLAEVDRPSSDSGSTAGHERLVKPAFYQVSAEGGAPLDQAPSPEPDVAERIERCLVAIETLQTRMDELHNQNQQILAALGIDDQSPAPPPPAGSLAEQVLDLQDSVKLLAANGEALRRVIEDQTVALRPVLPASTEGKLTVENNTDSDRQMWINGTAYWIWANSRLTVTVPVGPVTTKVGSEEVKTWEVANPGEEVRIEIVRTSRVTAVEP
jgi:hypothetical protein